MRLFYHWYDMPDVTAKYIRDAYAVLYHQAKEVISLEDEAVALWVRHEFE